MAICLVRFLLGAGWRALTRKSQQAGWLAIFWPDDSMTLQKQSLLGDFAEHRHWLVTLHLHRFSKPTGSNYSIFILMNYDVYR